MKFWVSLAAVCGLCLSGVASGQSLERSYAQLCTGKNKGSETCQTLRKALADKLASDATSSAGAATPAVVQQNTAGHAPRPYRGKAGVISPKWGFWSRLAGSTTVDEGEGTVRTYAWKDKGRVLGVDILARDKKTTSKLTLYDDGSIEVLPESGPPSVMAPAASGTFLSGDEAVRWRFYLSGKSVLAAEEKYEGGGWKATGNYRRRTIVPAREVAGIKARMDTERLALAAQVDREWGPLGRAIGRKFLAQSKTNPNDDAYFGYAWRELGKVAELQWFHFTASEPFAWTRFTRDPATGVISALDSDKHVSTVSFEGDTIRESRPRGSAQDVIDTILTNGAFQRTRYIAKKDKRKNESSVSYPDVTSTPWTQLADNFKQRSMASQQAKAAQQQAAAAQPKKSGGGGFLGALGGAMMGAIMSGGDVGSMIGGAAKGAAIVNPNSSAAGALGAIGDSMLSKGAVSAMGSQSGAGALASAVGSGQLGGGGGQYPNLASQYCPGMTADNYRTFALSGGSDRQLKTLCGEAFEYWHMTQNAVREGYGPQDVERTYSAHRDAAAVVKQFVAEAR